MASTITKYQEKSTKKLTKHTIIVMEATFLAKITGQIRIFRKTILIRIPISITFSRIAMGMGAAILITEMASK